MPVINTGTGWIEPQIDHISEDRRTSPRFEMQLPLTCRVVNSQWSALGWTRNLSSSGVAFEVPEPLTPGVRVELIIQWPTTTGEQDPREVVVRGRIGRIEGGLAALRVTQWRFRSQSKAVASGAAGFALP